MAPKVLVLLCHPDIEKSHVNRVFSKRLAAEENFTVHDLYKRYPSGTFDAAAREYEISLLREHDVIVMQFPMYWMQPPALLKEWYDKVHTFGVTYGPKADMLTGKRFCTVATMNMPFALLKPEGKFRFTPEQVLSPHIVSALYCGMVPLPPFVIETADELSDANIVSKAEEFIASLKE